LQNNHVDVTSEVKLLFTDFFKLLTIEDLNQLYFLCFLFGQDELA